MLGLLITLAASIGAIGMGKAMIGRLTTGLDPALRLAAHGLDGLAGLGILTLFIGLLPNGLGWGLWLVVAYVLAGWVFFVLDLRQNPLKASLPKGLDGLFLLVFVLGGLVSLAGVLSPSDTIDWDSLSYHLAVPKLFLQAGHIYPLFIHQSNFPSLVDYLYIWGLRWGEQYGAKAFSFCFYVFGLIAVYGVARGRYGQRAGLWAALAFGFVPVIMWESGTAYIDLANGLYAGLGTVFAAEWLADREKRHSLWLAALFLGYAAGSKYTGLQTILAVAVVIVALTRSAQGLKSAMLLGVVASLVACPWYIKNIVYVGNPVFPFFYSRLGGKNWDSRRAQIYSNQQQVFGIPAGETHPAPLPERVGSAVFGLAYKPWEYIDANAARTGAIGAAVLLAFFLWLVSGRGKKYEHALLGTVLITLAMWVVLSQQSRYMAPLVVPLAVLLGGGVVRLALGPLLAGVAALQAAYSLWVLETDRVTQQMTVLTGKISPEDYQKSTISFYEPAQKINEIASGGKVALYDETFGFLLNVPYMWANPGHSTEIPYDSMQNAADYVKDMKDLGFTYAYVNLRTMEGSRDAIQSWRGEAGLDGPPVTMPDRDKVLANWEQKYKVLIADAIAQHLLTPVQQFGSTRLLLKIE